MNFDAIFDLADTDTRTPLDISVECELIAKAREELLAASSTGRGGRRQPAYMQLLEQYLPALRGAVASELKRYGSLLTAEDARSHVLMAFTLAVKNAPEGHRVIVALANSIRHVADEFMLEDAYTVPARTAARFRSIVREVGGDVAAGLAICGDWDMSERSYLAAAEALGTWSSLEQIREEGIEPGTATEAGYEDIDTYLDAHRALVALPEGDGWEPSHETTVTRLAYGFDTARTQSDEEISEDLKRTALDADDEDNETMWTPSRSTVRRVREGALTIMHHALCDGTDARCNVDHTLAI